MVDTMNDLGVLIDQSLKFSQHITNICHRSGFVSSSIFRSFQLRSISFLTSLFKTYVRPILEYNTSVQNPHLVMDIDRIESV